MTLTHLDLDRIEGLAGRLREEALLADESDLDYPHYTEGALLTEAADALTAMIAYIRELEGALGPFSTVPPMGGDKNHRLMVVVVSDNSPFHLYEEDFRRARTALQRKTS